MVAFELKVVAEAVTAVQTAAAAETLTLDEVESLRADIIADVGAQVAEIQAAVVASAEDGSSRGERL